MHIAQKEIQVKGVVEAGFATDAEETVLDAMTLDEFLIGDRTAMYMLRVRGESMRDAGILDGDLVIVERTDRARVGDIVVAAVDGRYTMKYLREEAAGDGLGGRGVRRFLEPANPRFPRIYPDESLAIEAVVRSVVRKYS